MHINFLKLPLAKHMRNKKTSIREEILIHIQCRMYLDLKKKKINNLQSLTTDYKMYLIRVNVFSMLQDLCFSNLDQDLIFPSKKITVKTKK
jgi:predicted GNAT family N-acyltransferase